jgi:hypothetical protein
MKEKMFSMILIPILCYLGSFTAPSHALSIEGLEGKEFMVFMYCDDDAGDYCGEKGIKVEEFIFEDGDKFYIGSFEDKWLNSGSYDEQSILFEAEFSAVEDMVETYEFDIIGLNILDIIILGVCEVNYEYIIGLDEEDASCYFIGFSI